MDNLNDLESIKEDERSSSISENYEDYEPPRTQKSSDKWSTKVPITLVTKGNLSTRKAAKIYKQLSDSGIIISSPSQSGIYKAAMQSAELIETLKMKNGVFILMVRSWIKRRS